MLAACDIHCSNDIRRIGFDNLLTIAYGTIGGHEDVLVETLDRDLEHRAGSLICQDPRRVQLRREAHACFPRIVSCSTEMILRWQSRPNSRSSSCIASTAIHAAVGNERVHVSSSSVSTKEVKVDVGAGPDRTSCKTGKAIDHVAGRDRRVEGGLDGELPHE
jgi:hypothetical protein